MLRDGSMRHGAQSGKVRSDFPKLKQYPEAR
jgi:hypothetical protein